MALAFSGADTDRVEWGSGASLDNLSAFTILFWIYRTGTNTVDGSTLGTKGSFPDSRKELNLTFNATTIECVVDRATADASATSSTTTDANAWNFVGMSFGGTNGPKLFKGSLTAVVAEVAYSAGPTVGSGAVGDDSATNFQTGGRSGSPTGSFPGRIGWVGMWNVELSLAQIQEQQFRPHVTSGCVLFSHLGFAGTGTQPDWSGTGNSGTVTGATAADHVPLMGPFDLIGEWDGGFTAAAAASPKRLLTLGIGSVLPPLIPLWPAWWRWRRMRRCV